MNDIESQLRDAYQAATETVRAESIRPYVLPATLDYTHSPRRSSMFMPLAAATAVVVTIGAAVAVPRLVAQPSGAAPAPTASTGLGTTSPPFLVVNRNDRLEVRSATTGRMLGTVYRPDKHGLWVAVAATGDPRKFVVGLQLEPNGGPGYCVNSQPYSLLYTLTLSSSGAPDGLKPYPASKIPGRLGGPGGQDGTGGVPLAVSADGSTTAYVTMACIADHTNPKDIETIGVIRDGAVRKWTISMFANPASLSLSADGSELGYVTRPQTISPPGVLGSAWVLPTDATPGDATSRGHRVFTDAMNGAVQPVSEALSPDGKTMYFLTKPRYNHGKWWTNGLYATATASGARLRTLYNWKNIIIFIFPFLTTGGDKALVWDGPTIPIQEVDLLTGVARTFTQLPVSDMDPFAGLAW
jgi:hypothetical protein